MIFVKTCSWNDDSFLKECLNNMFTKEAWSYNLGIYDGTPHQFFLPVRKKHDFLVDIRNTKSQICVFAERWNEIKYCCFQIEWDRFPGGLCSVWSALINIQPYCNTAGCQVPSVTKNKWLFYNYSNEENRNDDDVVDTYGSEFLICCRLSSGAVACEMEIHSAFILSSSTTFQLVRPVFK